MAIYPLSETKRAYVRLEYLFWALIAAVFVLAILGVPGWFLNLVVSLFTSAIIGAIISFLATALVEELTGDFLKGYLIELDVFGFEFSISLFVVATITVRLWLFH